MKRVNLAAAALPVAGLMLPAMGANAATAAATGPQHDVTRSAKTVSLGHVRPAYLHDQLKARIDSDSRCGPTGATCVVVHGSGNHITSAGTALYHASRYQETLYLGYKTTFGSDNDAWKHWTGSWGSGLTVLHMWSPQCSLSNNAKVSGYGYHHKSSRPVVTITGHDFHSQHACY